MYEVVIEPGNGEGRLCYTRLPFIPQRGSTLVVERPRQRRRVFLLTSEASITARHESEYSGSDATVEISFLALEHL